MAIFRAKNTLLREEHWQMARAKRHFLPGHVWHITHRCHKKEFLLKFARDRCRWLQWLFEAKKRCGIRILNYMVTSNHIHLLGSCPRIGLYVISSGARNLKPKYFQCNKISRSARNDNFGAFSDSLLVVDGGGRDVI